MTSRITLALSLLATTPVLAQPASKQPAPPPAAPKAPAAPASKAPTPPPAKAPAVDDPAAFDKELDALFSSGGLTPDQAAARAATASLDVRAKAAQLDAAIAQLETAKLARVPIVSGKASYTRLSEVDPATVTVAGMTFQLAPSLVNSYLGEAQVVVPLSDHLLRFPKVIDAAKLAADVSALNKRTSELNAGYDARITYYEWVRANLQALVARRQVAQVQKTLGQIRALAEVQRLSRADLLRVESQAAQAEQLLDLVTNVAQLREEQLRLQIGASSAEPLAIGEDIRADVAGAGSAKIDELVDTALRQRTDFKAIDTGLAAKDQQRAAEEANLWPRLSAFGVADYANPNQRIFPTKDEFSLTWSVGAQLTWTLNDALVSRATDRRLSAETRELRAGRENLERGTRLQLLAAHQAIEVAQHALATTQKGLIAAEEGYRVRKELLNADRATAVELVDAETELTRARVAALNARVDLRVARAQLEHWLGGDAK